MRKRYWHRLAYLSFLIAVFCIAGCKKHVAAAPRLLYRSNRPPHLRLPRRRSRCVRRRPRSIEASPRRSNGKQRMRRAYAFSPRLETSKCRARDLWLRHRRSPTPQRQPVREDLRPTLLGLPCVFPLQRLQPARNRAPKHAPAWTKCSGRMYKRSILILTRAKFVRIRCREWTRTRLGSRNIAV